jgi:MoaA/NifB/PqqE/SkfB family radical SAM enzyme/integrase
LWPGAIWKHRILSQEFAMNDMPAPRALTEQDQEHCVPVYVVWETTLACNLKCGHCGSRAGSRRDDELNTAEAFDLIDQMAALGTREITVIGGEAFLRKDWLKLIERISSHGILCTMQTGAYGLNEKMLRAAMQAGLGGIGVSVDGLEEDHDRIRGRKGSYQACLKALRIAKDLGMVTSANTQINAISYQYLREVFDIVADTGISHWQLQWTVAMGNAADNDEVLLQPYLVKPVMDEVAEIFKHGQTIGVTVRPGNNIGYFGKHEVLWRGGQGGGHYAGCPAGHNAIGIGFLDRHGKVRWYFRRPGFKRVALSGLPWSPEFMAAYEKAMTGIAPVAAERSKPGTIAALVAYYYRSSEYQNLKPITQRTYRSTMEPFREQHGEKTVANLKREHIKAIVAKLSDRPAVANNWLKSIRILMRFALDSGMRADDPTAGLRKLRTGSTGYRTWTEAEIEQFYGVHPIGGKARLALDLLLYTGQRRADVVRMGRQHFRDGVLTIRQSKTGTEVEIPLHPVLSASLEALPQKNMTFLLTEYGKPFAVAGFGNWFRDRVVEAGLPNGLSAHGLRKSACRRLAEAGCTGPQIMAISGHKNLKEVQTYIDAADRLGLARQALQKQMLADENRTRIVKPGS